MSADAVRRSRLVPATVAVALALAAVGAGAANGWRINPFSDLSGRAEKAIDDWCSDHGVPKSGCVECDSTLFPRRPALGWCSSHGVHECPLCHPESAELPLTP